MPKFEGFDGDAHPFVTGQLMGLMMREGWKVHPVMDDEGYTNKIVMEHPDVLGKTYVVVVQSSREALAEA